MPEAAKLNGRDNGGGMTTRILPTPPTTISKMNQAQLKKFVPQLLSHVSGQARPSFGPHDRPVWWPADIPWNRLKLDSRTAMLKEVLSTESLKKAIKNCYRHYGQERVLHGKLQRPESASSPVTSPLIINNYYCDVANVVNNATINLRDTQPWVQMPSAKPSLRTRLVNRSLLPDLGHSAHTPMEAYPRQGMQSFVEIFICFFCEKEFGNKVEMTRHQSQCRERPPELQAILTPPRPSYHINPPQISPALPRVSTTRPPKPGFMKQLNLVQCHKAKQIQAKFRESVDVDCEIIDVIEPPKTPVPATPPRTPKSLISQLSREDPWPRRKSLNLGQHQDMSDKESVCSAASENEPEKLGKCPRNTTLLTIPVSSLLGQRIRKHVKVEGLSTLVPDVEKFCKTPVKNAALQRLRERHNTFPVTFKKTRRMKTRHVHEFKFNRRQRYEFLECIKVGLNRRSLKLFKTTKGCSVRLKRLSKVDLKRWLTPSKPRPMVVLPKLMPGHQILWGPPEIMRMLSNNSAQVLRIEPIFPEQPGLLSADVDRLLGLKKKPLPDNRQHQHALPLGSMVSEHLNAEASQQKLTVYRSLLSEYSSVHSAQQQNLNFSMKKSLPVPKINNACLASLLNKPRKPEASLALRPLLPKPVSVSSNHVQDWLSSNSFPGEVRPCLLVKNANSANPTVTVINKTVPNGSSRAGKRPHGGPNVDSSNKRQCTRSTEKQHLDDDQSSCTSDSVSIRTISSSDDDDETLSNIRLKNLKTKPPPNYGLPVIQNTFSLPPESLRLPSTFNPVSGPVSSGSLKLRIPSDLKLQIPATVPRVVAPPVNVQQRTRPNILRSRSQISSSSPASSPQKPATSASTILNLVNSSPRPAGHYSLRSVSPAKEAAPRITHVPVPKPQDIPPKMSVYPLKLQLRLGPSMNLKPLASSTPNMKSPASSSPVMKPLASSTPNVKSRAPNLKSVASSVSNPNWSPRRRSQRLQSYSQGFEGSSSAARESPRKQSEENRAPVHEVIYID